MILTVVEIASLMALWFALTTATWVIEGKIIKRNQHGANNL